MERLNIDESAAVLYSMLVKENNAQATWVSENVESITGYSAAQILQPGWWESIIHPEDRQVEQDVTSRLQHQGYITYEYRVLFSDGRYHWIRDQIRVMPSESTNETELLGVWRDITQEREIQALLQQEHERLEYTLEATGDGMWDWCPDTATSFWTDNNWYMLGLTPTSDGLIDASLWKSLCHPDDFCSVEQSIQDICQQRKHSIHIEYRLRHQAGHWVWVLVRGKVVEWHPDGRPARVMGLHTNVTEKKQAELELHQQKQMLDQLTHQVPGMLSQFTLHPSGDVEMTYIDGQITALFGVTAEEARANPMLLAKNIHPDDLASLIASRTEAAAHMENWEYRYRLMSESGEVRWLEGVSRFIPQSDGSTVWYGYTADVTDSVLAEQKQRLAASVFAHTHEAIFITDADSKIIEINPMFTQITGYSAAEIVGQHVSALLSSVLDEALYHQVEKCLEQNGFWQGEAWGTKKCGTLYCQRITVSAIYDNSGAPTHFIALFSDITGFKQQQQKLEYQAYHDSLTGLPNRTLLFDRLEQALAAGRRNHTYVSLIYIDLDDFKPINDKYGHATGDMVLKTIAKRITECLRDTDTASRIGGDEFIVLVNSDTKAGYQCILERLGTAINTPVVIDSAMVTVSACVGITHAKSSDTSPETMIKQADEAMYLAKRDGKNKSVEYTGT
ncbi:hypothetical protein CWE15_06935 [Aliidiomarina taiwanensis]|uniref:Sensor domain-containing diguanylate cyclase n=1 Tax=Aliidiomarina taiwanensis TaxID=946228 RepID=A0A432X209_9GAMM|nr:PAS domain-containing protein [Aliidiomarina taiwanensis]RUO40488.1 hypothetical protein CWE15_06935 [Aliidiomarina taiwanensis]